jgi:hypothetical protein
MTSYISPFTGDVVVPTDVSYVSYTLAASLQLTWPANGTDADNVAARIMDVQTPNFAFKLEMPPASQTSVGTDALIRNTGAVNLEVTNTNLGTITTILPGVAAYIYLTDNTTANGVWGVFTFGAGTSTANAATLAGYGILAAGLTLNQSHPVTNLTASYVFSAADRAQVLEWPTSGGTTTVTLPLASTLGNNWFFMFKNNGTGIVNLATTSGELLDGSASSKTFAPSESAFVICNGSAFITVGYGVSTLFNFTAATKALTTGTVTLGGIKHNPNIHRNTHRQCDGLFPSGGQLVCGEQSNHRPLHSYDWNDSWFDGRSSNWNASNGSVRRNRLLERKHHNNCGFSGFIY